MIDTFLLAKGFYNISNAKKYFAAIKESAKAVPHATRRVVTWYQRLNWIEMDLLTILPSTTADVFRKEVSSWETLAFDNVFDQMVLMDENKRLQVEAFCKQLNQQP